MKTTFEKVLADLENMPSTNKKEITEAFDILKDEIAIVQEHKFKKDPIFLQYILQSMIAFKNKDIYSDRFFLEEIIFRILKGENDYALVLLTDWLSEIVLKSPINNEIERKFYSEKQGEKEYYLDSEETLKYVIDNKDLPNDYLEETEEYYNE